MRFTLKTKVTGHYQSVFDQFDEDLFLALSPPLVDIELRQFDGCKVGDRVHIDFVRPIKTSWVSVITEADIDERRAIFVDEGKELPKPLRSWKHRHIVEHLTEESCTIIDDIRYSCGYFLGDVLLFPFLYVGFYMRKAIYRRYFESK